MTRAPALLIVACLLSSVALSAQDSDLNARLKVLSSLPKSDTEYRLGPGDLVEISVFGVDNFHHVLRISASGIIKLPLLDPIKAQGLTSAELEQRLAALLQDEVIKDPQVSVFVKEYRSQPVFVLGAVKTPGQYQISLQLRIVDAISMAGGLLPNADEVAVIQRSSDDGEQTLQVNLRDLLEKGDLSLNTVVRGGDVIHIKERQARTVYVVGDVNRAGAFGIPARQELRITQVFAWAGGPMRTAKLAEGVLIRYNDKGEREQRPVNFGEILKGKKEDFFVQADDVIFVPGSKMKALGYGLLGGLPNTLASLPYVLVP